MKRIAGMNKAIKQRDNGISKMSTLKLTFRWKALILYWWNIRDTTYLCVCSILSETFMRIYQITLWDYISNTFKRRRRKEKKD